MRLVLGARLVINNLASIIIDRQKIDTSDPIQSRLLEARLRRETRCPAVENWP